MVLGQLKSEMPVIKDWANYRYSYVVFLNNGNQTTIFCGIS